MPYRRTVRDGCGGKARSFTQFTQLSIDQDHPGASRVNERLEFMDENGVWAQIALQETRLFLDRLLNVPCIRLASRPSFGWWDTISSYELRGAVVDCERQPAMKGH